MFVSMALSSRTEMSKCMAASTLPVPSAYFPIKMVARPAALSRALGAAVTAPSKCLTTPILTLMAVPRSISGEVEMD